MLSPKNIIVVGGNAAGPAAAAKAKRAAPGSNVLMLEAGNFISTGTCELPYVLSEEIKNYNDIVFFNPESFENEKGVKVLVNHFVEKIDRVKKYVKIRNLISNQTFDQNYDRLILATGSRAKKIPDLPANLKNVFSLKSVQDLLLIKDYLQNKNVRNVLIAGAGYLGLEIADALKSKGYNVTIYEKEKLPLPVTDSEIQNLLLDLLMKNGVEYLGGVSDPKFICKDEKLVSVNFNGRIIEYDLVLSAIGFEPNNDLAVGAKLLVGKSGGIRVDSKLRTSDPNIFAAGDNIEVINGITKQYEFIPLATFAQQYGHIAGENAAGGNSFIRPVVKNIAVKIFDKCLATVGLNSAEAAANRFNYGTASAVAANLIKVMTGSENVFGKIIFEKSSKRILGACFLGGNEVTGYGDMISSFINNNIKADELENINYNYTPPLSPFIHLLSVLGKKISKEK